MSSISVGIITVGLSTISDRSENDRLRGTHYLDRPMSKWKYCMRMSAHFFPLSWPVRCFFFFFLLNQPFIFFTLFSLRLNVCAREQAGNAGSHEEGSRRIYQY